MEIKSFDDFRNAVREGAHYEIDLVKRTARLNGKYIVRGGDTIAHAVKVRTVEEFTDRLEKLYVRFFWSRPSERSMSHHDTYFYAQHEDELDDPDFFYAIDREEARCEIESFVLEQTLAGFKWDDEKMGKWFWQSKTHKNLVLLRKWFE